MKYSVTELLGIIAVLISIHEAACKTFTIGVVLPEDNSCLSNSSGEIPWALAKGSKAAIMHAVNYINNYSSLLAPDHNLEVLFANWQCSEKNALTKAINLTYYHYINLLLAPVRPDLLLPIAASLPQLGISVISAGGFEKVFTDKNEYAFTRIGGTFEKVCNFIILLFKKFSWFQPALIKSKHKKYSGEGTVYHNNYCFSFGEEFNRKWWLEMGETLSQVLYIEESIIERDEKMEENLTATVNRVLNQVRIVILCDTIAYLREFLRVAQREGFQLEKYVFIQVDLFSMNTVLYQPWFSSDATPEENDLTKEAFKSVKIITWNIPDTADSFTAANQSLSDRSGKFSTEKVNHFVTSHHDAVILYALALNDSLRGGASLNNVSMISTYMRKRKFIGIGGEVTIDANGDREIQLALLDITNHSSHFMPVGVYYSVNMTYEPVPDISLQWAQLLGKESQQCGFDGSRCDESTKLAVPAYSYVIVVICGVMVLTLAVSRFLRYRSEKNKLSEDYLCIDNRELTFGNFSRKNPSSPKQVHKVPPSEDGDTFNTDVSNDINFIDFSSPKTALYKDKWVTVTKQPFKQQATLEEDIRQQIKLVKELKCQNVLKLYGVCRDGEIFPSLYLVTEYCERGTLKDFLDNDKFKPDNLQLKCALIQDIAAGMKYLHKSGIVSHGSLNSTNCLVDGFFMVKITGFGLTSLRQRKDREVSGKVDQRTAADKQQATLNLYVAPELLRLQKPDVGRGTQEGDVYSYGILCQEVLYRNGVFWVKFFNLTAQEKCEIVLDGKSPVFRPTLTEETNPMLQMLITQCWQEEPNIRPSFSHICSVVNKVNKPIQYNYSSLSGNLLLRFEQYSHSLEDLVDQRSAEVAKHKQTTKTLLYSLLPSTYAEHLLQGERVNSEKYDVCTVYYGMISGVDEMCKFFDASQIVNMLNSLYERFDSCVLTYNLTKVTGVGDGYMVVSNGVKIKEDQDSEKDNGSNHAFDIARLALTLRQMKLSFQQAKRIGTNLTLNVGIHSGSVFMGIIGRKLPKFCVFGETVEIAVLLQTKAKDDKIYMSHSTKELLENSDSEYKMIDSGEQVQFQGKDDMTIWCLDDEKVAKHMLQTLPSIEEEMVQERPCISELNRAEEYAKRERVLSMKPNGRKKVTRKSDADHFQAFQSEEERISKLIQSSKFTVGESEEADPMRKPETWEETDSETSVTGSTLMEAISTFDSIPSSIGKGSLKSQTSGVKFEEKKAMTPREVVEMSNADTYKPSASISHIKKDSSQAAKAPTKSSSLKSTAALQLQVDSSSDKMSAPAALQNQQKSEKIDLSRAAIANFVESDELVIPEFTRDLMRMLPQMCVTYDGLDFQSDDMLMHI